MASSNRPAATFVVSQLGVRTQDTSGKFFQKIEMVAFLYTKKRSDGSGYTSWKFPTETAEETDKTAWSAVVNGLPRELLVDPSPLSDSELHVYPADCEADGSPKPLLTVSVVGDVEKGGGIHTKPIFRVVLAPAVRSRFRKDNKDDAPDEVLGPPDYFEARELLKKMKERGVEFHIVALLQVLSSFSVNPEVYNEYRDILEDPEYRQYLADEADLSRYFQQRQAEREKKRTNRLRHQGR